MEPTSRRDRVLYWHKCAVTAAAAAAAAAAPAADAAFAAAAAAAAALDTAPFNLLLWCC